MTWWGPGFNPVFDIENVENDLSIIEGGIAKTIEGIGDLSPIEDNHKIIWDYWNDMANYIDRYMERSTGLSLKYGLLADSNVMTMAATTHDDVIWQISTEDAGEGYYFGLKPNPKYLYGIYRTDAPNIPDPAPDGYDINPQTVVFGPIEPGYIAYEIENMSGVLAEDALARRTAQEGQRDTANDKRGFLDSLVADCNSGFNDYPAVGLMLGAATIARDSCIIAAANAQAEIDNGSPSFSAGDARYIYLTARSGEITINSDLVKGEAKYIRDARYFWTDMRCGTTNGSASSLDASTSNLVRLNNEKIRLETLLQEYGEFA